jgi:hypothetical protein
MDAGAFSSGIQKKWVAKNAGSREAVIHIYDSRESRLEATI